MYVYMYMYIYICVLTTICQEPFQLQNWHTLINYLYNQEDGELTASQMNSFCERLKVPKKFKTIAKRATAYKLVKKEFRAQLGNDIIALLDVVGGFKNDHLLPKLLLLYELELDTKLDTHSYVSAKELLAINNAVKEMNNSDLIQQNF